MKKLSLLERMRLACHYLLPARLISECAGFLADKHLPFFTNAAIKLFMKKYQISLDECVIQNPQQFATFNEFFTRKLHSDARIISTDAHAIAAPADGMITQYGSIRHDRLFQAKGHAFSLSALLAHHTDLVQSFSTGSFAIIYLSPRDYHRVHMPCDATLRKTIYVGGELFSVNPFLSEHIPNIFARNERLICEFDSKQGKMVQILIGATITGSIITSWAGRVNTRRGNDYVETDYSQNQISLSKGQEMGAFALGSTVITLFEQGVVFNENMHNQAVKMGSDFARFGEQ